MKHVGSPYRVNVLITCLSCLFLISSSHFPLHRPPTVRRFSAIDKDVTFWLFSKHLALCFTAQCSFINYVDLKKQASRPSLTMDAR